jgi:DNA-binding HxlR family transcriptional regulator
LSSDEEAKVAMLVKLAGCLKTESRVRMLMALRKGASRPLDVVKQSGENPSTLYRVVDEMIEAGVVERTEPVQGEVHWRLTDLGVRLVSSVEGAAFPGPTTPRPVKERPWWIHFVVPVIVIAVSGVRAVQSSEAGYVAGGVIFAVAAYFITKRVLK